VLCNEQINKITNDFGAIAKTLDENPLRVKLAQNIAKSGLNNIQSQT